MHFHKIKSKSKIVELRNRTQMIKLFSVSGCMYRGNPPQGQLLHLSSEDQMCLVATKVASLRLSNIGWNFNNMNSSNRVRIETFLKLKHSSHEFPASRQITCSSLEGRLRQGF